MSRQIKFRVWDSQIKRFRGSHIAGQKNTVWGLKIDHGIFEIPNGNGLTVQVFTGLLDKNGCEIYEGDIVEQIKHSVFSAICENEEGLFHAYPLGHRFKVEWSRYSFLPFGVCSEQDIEVIGNIFENPELLK